MPTPQVTRLAAATALYDKMDQDKNGAVSLEELFCTLQAAGLCGAEEAHELFKKVDADASGQISREEFLQYFGNEVAQERGKLLSKLIDAKGVVVVSYDAIVRHFIKASRVEDELVRIVSQMVPPKQAQDKQTDHQYVNAYLKSLTDADFSEQLGNAIPLLLGAYSQKLAASIVSSGAAAGEASGSKFTTEANLPVAAFGGTEFFFKGLDGVLGLPSVHPEKSILDEFRQRADSKMSFQSWNSGKINTTPQKEIDFVVMPYTRQSVLTGDDYSAWELTYTDGFGGLRVPIRLEVFLHALCAVRLDNSSHASAAGTQFQSTMAMKPMGASNHEESGFQWEIPTEREAEKTVREATMKMDKSNRQYISQLPPGSWESMTWLHRLHFLEGKLSLVDIRKRSGNANQGDDGMTKLAVGGEVRQKGENEHETEVRVENCDKEVLGDDEVLGLRWEEVSSELLNPDLTTSGKEIKNETLAVALQQKTEFTHEEWAGMKVDDLTPHSFIKVCDRYFKPGGTVSKETRDKEADHLKVAGREEVSANDAPREKVLANDVLCRYGDYKTASSRSRDDPLYLNQEEIFLVKIVLLRFVKSQIEPVALRNSLHAFGAAGEEDLADRSIRISTALKNAFHDTRFASRFEARRCRAAYEVVQEAMLIELSDLELEALMDHFQMRLRTANFSRADIIGVRLYTGPPYVKMNGVMRYKSGAFSESFLKSAVLEGNQYINTINAAVSGLLKLSKASSIPTGGALFRGMAGIKLPTKFVTPEEGNGRGGVEFAFMSTTTAKEVAASYIDTDKELPTMFVFGVGTIDKGAAVSLLSQFPDEEEVLLPPLSWIEVTGDPYLEQTEKGDVMMIPARVNCNLKSRTIEEIISRRRQELLSMRDSLFQELERNLHAFEESFQEILKTKGKEETFVNVKQRLAADFAERSNALELKEPSWFNDDTNYQDCINEAIDFKVDNMVMLLHELFDSTLVSFAKEGNAKGVSACLASGYAPTQRNEMGQTALHTASMNGHAAIVRSLVSQIKLKEGYEEIINLADSRHRTALHYGAECGFPEVVEILLETGANINKSEEVLEISDDVLAPRTPLKPQHDKDKDIKKKGRELKRDKVRAVPPPVTPPSVTPLHLAVSNGRTAVVAVLVQPRWGCEVMKTQSYQSLSALHMAASHGHAEIASLLLQAGHQINVESSGGTPPLHMAAESNKVEVVKVLLSNKCDINKLGPHRETALQVSARNGHVEVVRLLVASGANVHSRDEWGQTALHLAAIHGDSQSLGSLLAKHKDLLDELDLDNRTPLHNAAEYGHVDACQKMLEFKCDISVRDRQLKTALQHAESNGHTRVATMLRKFGTTGQLF